MDDHKISRAPNYTNACIIMFGVNLAWILVAVWVTWGLVAAALLAMGINHLMTRVADWSARRHAHMIRRGKQI